jgi:hypothetical protein
MAVRRLVSSLAVYSAAKLACGENAAAENASRVIALEEHLGRAARASATARLIAARSG